MKPTHLVVQPYQSAYPDPIILNKGETLTTSDRQADWPGWIWCTTASGDSRWVPDVFLDLLEGLAVLRRDYNPVELSVHPGEQLTAQELVNGWAWCTNQVGQQGWVPLDSLQAIQDEG
jgi:hypothetical protein